MEAPVEIPDNLFDRVEAYYSGELVLNSEEEKLVERWEAAYATLSHVRVRSRAVEKHKKAFNLSQSSAYNDMRRAERIFAPLLQYTKEFIRLTLIEKCFRDLDQCKKKLKKSDGIYEWRAVKQIEQKAIDQLAKLSGLDREDPNVIDPEKLQQHQIEISAPTSVKNMLKNIAAKGDVDISQIAEYLAQNSDTVGYEEAT